MQKTFKLKLTVTLCFIFFNLTLNAQIKQISVLDGTNKKPLSGVSINILGDQEGLLSNDDGIFVINILTHQKDSLKLSYLGFKNRFIRASDLSDQDTILLTPISIVLQEVNLYSINLKAKFDKFYRNYWNYYSSNSKSYDCTFKEVLKVNDSIARLNQIQMKWYNQNYRYPFGKNIKKDLEKENQFSIVNVDYAKIKENNSIFSSTGYLENDDLIKYMFSNFYSLFINECSDIKIESITNYLDDKKIVFSSPLIENGKMVMNLDSGIVFFENGTDAIKNIKLYLDYNDNSLKGVEKNLNIPYITSVKNVVISISFQKNGGKWFLSNYNINTCSTSSFKDKVDILNLDQKLIITKVESGKKILKDKRIDINHPFFTNLPLYKNIETKIILTKEEQAFMDKK